ncbi:MAG TPA: hypothetical protein VFG84_11780 [Gemmatimonadaceae bacterium]|nr:hypothetical protein [Gemmatimonadaceae bacterium]
MRALLVQSGSIFAALLATLVAVPGARQSPPEPAAGPAAWATFERAEVARVRAHLARVETELRSADVSRLSPAQRTARSHHIDVLHDYREAGVFPHNHTAAKDYTPVFVDEHGTHCAVGFLIAESGRDDIVSRIASTRNHATVPELADDPALVAWLDASGLSLAEATRIQPAYNLPPWSVVEPSRSRTSDDYATGSMVATGLGGGMIAWNLLTDRSAEGSRLPGALGVGVGMAEIALGGIGLALDDRDDRDIKGGHILINFAVGLASTALGFRTLLTDPAPPSETSPVAQRAKREDVAWRVSPWRPAGEGGAGLMVTVRF